MEIKNEARQAFREQQTQDNEGGVPCAVGFVAGFLDGARGRFTRNQVALAVDRAFLSKVNADFKIKVVSELENSTPQPHSLVKEK